MSARSLLLTAVLLSISSSITAAQVPADLRAASQARIASIARADAATWDRLTSDSFTVFGVTNHVITKAQRLAGFKQQTPSAPVTPSYEHWQRAGTAFVHRYQIDNLMVHEIWSKERSAWRVASIQVTVVDPDSAVARQAIDSTHARSVAAFKRGDVAELASFYTEEAVLMPANMPAWQGRAAISQGLTGFLAQFAISDARLATQDIIVSGYYVIERGTYTWSMHPKTGTGADIVDNGKYLTVWERQDDGSWKISRDISNSDRPAGM
jgi:ketosteroid isomerase-like protein